MRKALMAKADPHLTNSIAPIIPPITFNPSTPVIQPVLPDVITAVSNTAVNATSNIIQVIPQPVATPGAPNVPVLPPRTAPQTDLPNIPQGGTEPPVPPEELESAPPPDAPVPPTPR
jgi:hypothetical protein